MTKEEPVFMIMLRLTNSRDKAPALMDGHRKWIASGRDAGVFLLVGSLADGAGGAILAHGENLKQIKERLAQDPFVSEGIVEAEIHEFEPALVDERLQFLGPVGAGG